ncbi:putative leucine aminopeptidase 2 [Calycina marina]|uniref:Peptide hydrolase n=1 Tax=Calycina marina TaxID=1763456 RepID=A0A9P8CAR5_9HELO|nr:putative leucine aminopeptidase 2 [Calycina marina]
MELLFLAFATIVAFTSALPEEKRALPPVESSKFRRVLWTNLLAKSQLLQDFAYSTLDRNRLIGRPGHEKTIQYLVDTLNATDYYDVSLQPFNTTDPHSADLTVESTVYKVNAMTESPEGTISAPLVAVSNLGCNSTDSPAATTGKIALVSRGTCSFQIKSLNAKAAGAVAAVVYNNIDGTLSGTLGVPGDYIPIIGVFNLDGLPLLQSLGKGNLKIEYLPLITYNVIAQSKIGDPTNVLHLGAHSDSVEAGPGINDNGSDSIGLLELTIQLTAFSVNNAVRFSWWAAEEEGLLGSVAYVDALTPEENAKIRLYLNFDMTACPNFVHGIYDGDGSAFNVSGASGSAEVEKLFQDFYTYDEGIPWQASQFDGRSDYDSFLDVGISVGGLDTDADDIKMPEQVAIFGGTAGIQKVPNYHSAGDTVSNLNVGAFLHNTKAIAHAVATYGTSWVGFPARLPVAAKTKELVAGRFKKGKYVLLLACDIKLIDPGR